MQPRISHLLYRIYGTVYNWPLIRPVHQRIDESTASNQSPSIVIAAGFKPQSSGGWVGFVYELA